MVCARPRSQASCWPRPETNNGPVSKAARCPVQPPSGFLMLYQLRQLRLICNAFCTIMVQWISISITPYTKTISLDAFKKGQTRLDYNHYKD